MITNAQASYASRRKYWSVRHRAVTSRRDAGDRLICEFEYLPGRTAEQIADEALRELHRQAAAVHRAGLADRYGVFLDVYMNNPAVYLRDRAPHLPPAFIPPQEQQ